MKHIALISAALLLFLSGSRDIAASDSAGSSPERQLAFHDAGRYDYPRKQYPYVTIHVAELFTNFAGNRLSCDVTWRMRDECAGKESCRFKPRKKWCKRGYIADSYNMLVVYDCGARIQEKFVSLNERGDIDCSY